MNSGNIMLVGVGGQGTILASNLLTLGLMEAGYDVKMSEIHGMSQRGGSVSSQIRYGEKVSCPVIELGGADMIIAFEKLEALRNLCYLKPEGTVVINDLRIDPIGVLSQTAEYPNNVIERIQHSTNTIVIPASTIAEELENSRVMNIILLGAIAKHMGLENVNWNELLEQNIKSEFVEINKTAFEKGFNYA